MKIAVAGKGGTGKTSIAGTLARLLAREGREVLAIDADSGPNLGLTLGLPAGRLEALPTLPGDVMRVIDGRLRPTRPLGGVRRACAVATPDGVELLVMARPDQAGTGCLSHLHGLVRVLVRDEPDDERRACVLDLDPSPEGFSRGVATHADLLLIVAEPFPAARLAAERMAALAADMDGPRVALVANKVRTAAEGEALGGLADRLGLELAAEIPSDPAFARAERIPAAPLDVAPGSPGIAAIAELCAFVSRPVLAG